MENLTPKTLANIVERAALIKEESFDHKAANEADKKDFFPDYKQFYRINLEKAVDLAVKEAKVDPRFAQYIYLSFHWWNDILDWAKRVKGEDCESN